MPPVESLHLPPGFRFHPTDDELVTHYLVRKCASLPIAVPIVAEIDLYKYDPWELPDMALYGEKEWYFFSPRDRKYPNGSRPNRAAGSGYWKATGADKPIGKPKPLGIKKALVFYAGKAPRGEKTNWIMHEYRLADVDRSARKKNNSLRLDDWVLCRIYNKKGAVERQTQGKQEDIIQEQMNDFSEMEEQELKPEVWTKEPSTAVFSEMAYHDTTDSVPKLHTDSSCGSEQVVSPGFEVQSQPKQNHLEKAALDFPFNYMDAGGNVFGMQNNYQMSPLQDMFMYLPKPF